MATLAAKLLALYELHKRGLLTELLTARAESGTSLVVACHDPDMTEALGDYVLDFESW